MNFIQINKFSKVPLYLQIKDSIKSAILSGAIKNNDKLPTEESICQFYHVSRPVVRQAYQELIDEGLIKRHQGQGTFVSRSIVLSNIFFKQHFKEELLSRGIIPESHILSCDLVKAEDISIPARTLPPEHSTYYSLIRLRKGNGIPLFLEYFYIPTALFPDLPGKIQDDISLSKLLMDGYGYPRFEDPTEMQAIVIDEPMATLLEVKPGSAAIKFTIDTLLPDGRLAFYKVSYFPGERHRVDIEVTEP